MHRYGRDGEEAEDGVGRENTGQPAGEGEKTGRLEGGEGDTGRWRLGAGGRALDDARGDGGIDDDEDDDGDEAHPPPPPYEDSWQAMEASHRGKPGLPGASKVPSHMLRLKVMMRAYL